MTKLLLLLSLVLIGCGTTETVIRDRMVYVQVPAIHDTITARSDTIIDLADNMPQLIIEGEKVVGRDTIVIVKYRPAKHQFDIEVKRDSVGYHDIDTTKTHTTIVEKTPFLSKMGLVLIGVLVCIGGVVLLKLKGIL
jgi:hypothetical protein